MYLIMPDRFANGDEKMILSTFKKKQTEIFLTEDMEEI
jgi:hypothetical protein